MTVPPLDMATLEDLYQRAPCGYLTTALDGTILRVNGTFLEWTGFGHDALIGSNLRDLLTAGGRLFYETNYTPVLHLQHAVRDVALEVRRTEGDPLPVLISSNVVFDTAGEPELVRSTVFDASSRHELEGQLQAARRRAEDSEQAIRSIAVQLQRSLLPAVVEDAPGFTVTTRYQPAMADLEVGGDWYDAFALPGRDVLSLSVGDVVGRGIDAACAMGQARSALRAIALSGVGPGATLHQLDAFAERLPAAHAATVVCAELAVAERTVRYACAGHLPPLLVEPDGTATYLWDGRSLPLAMGALGGTRGEGTVTLAPGAALVFYTDGLVERRDRGLDEGMDLLATLMAEHGPDAADGVLDRLIASMLDGEVVHDDVCILHLYVEPSAYTAVVAGFEGLRELRRGLEAWMTELGVDRATAGEVVLAAVELATNGIEASPTGEASVRAQGVGGTLRIVVHNEGTPFRGLAGVPVVPDRGRGRGLAVVAALTDSVAFGEVEGATKVTITRRFQA